MDPKQSKWKANNNNARKGGGTESERFDFKLQME